MDEEQKKPEKVLTWSEWEASNFHQALVRIPPPIPCFRDGACCPWCGQVHTTVSFGLNECKRCRRNFAFGFPTNWEAAIPECPETWVNFPSDEFDRLGGKADLIPEFKPSEFLKKIWERADKEIERANQDRLRILDPEPRPEGETLQ